MFEYPNNHHAANSFVIILVPRSSFLGHFNQPKPYSRTPTFAENENGVSNLYKAIDK